MTTIDATALSYFLAYKTLIREHHSYCAHYSEKISMYLFPAVVVMALSCEIALKAKCNKIRKKHDLKTLFSSLDEKMQEKYIKETIRLYNMKSEQCNSTDRLTEETFWDNLKSNKDVFMNCRYLYEGVEEADMDFLEAFMYALVDEGENYKEYLSSYLGKTI